MRPALALAGLAALVLVSAPSTEGADTSRSPVTISVSPAHLALTAPSSSRIKLRNDGSERVVVDVKRRTVSGQKAAKTWLQIVPARFSLRPGESVSLTLRLRPPRHAEPGEHQVLVLLTTRPLRGGRVNVQVRLGVRIRMIVPGRITRRLVLGALRVHRGHGARFMFVSIANRGNVTVQLRGRVTASLVRGGRQPVRLSPRGRRVLLPGGRAALALRYSGRLRGRVTVLVRVRLGSGLRVVERRYRIRL